MERSYLPTISGYIPRPRVDALVNKGLGYSLVLVVAGPGYGKTLSLAHYMKGADVRLVWLRVSNLRTKAADFWDDLVRAAARELPAYAEKLGELGFPQSPGSFEEFREMTTDEAGAGRRLVFVVDNYERILDRDIVRFLNRLVDSDLPNLTLYILCNVMLPFAEVLPATGQLRITDENLAFTLEEAGAMFKQYGTSASPDIVRRAVKVTGGWPLGLRLVCESRPENPEDFSSRSPVQMTADLYEQHYYSNYARDVQTQLVLFSLLPQFALDMARAEMETPWESFAGILMHHPFISYDYGNGLYLYQPMYHEFLRQRHNLLSLEARRDTMAYAGRWFLDRKMVNEAMDCFWEAADYDGYLEAVAAQPKVRKPVEITGRILERLEQIPRSYADGHLAVKFSIAFMHLNAANMYKARELLLEVASQLESGPDSEERRLLLGDSYAALADIATYLNEDTGLEWMKKAYEQAPDGTHIHSPELLSLGNNTVFFLPNNEAGQLEHMVEYFFAYAKYADAVKNGCGHGYEYLFAGEAALSRCMICGIASLLTSMCGWAMWIKSLPGLAIPYRGPSVFPSPLPENR